MDEQAINTWMMLNAKCFGNKDLCHIRNSMIDLPKEKQVKLVEAQFKDPMLIFIISFLLGVFGIDRFLIGDTLYGLLKLLTLSGLGIFWIIDLCLIQERTKEKNLELFSDIVL